MGEIEYHACKFFPAQKEWPDFEPILSVDGSRLIAIHASGLVPLGINPAVGAASGEARRVNGEVPFDSPEGDGRLNDKLFQKGRQRLVLKVLGDGVEVRDGGAASNSNLGLAPGFSETLCAEAAPELTYTSTEPAGSSPGRQAKSR